MVKTPRTRHSRSAKEPVTIDLPPGEVSRVKAEAEKAEPAQTKEARGPAATKAEPPKPAGKPEDAATAQARPADPTPEPAAKEPEKPKAPAAESAAREQASKPSAASFAAGSASGFGRQRPAPGESRRGALAGGVAGGVIALALAGGLYLSGLLPGAGTAPDDHGPAIAALEARIAELQGEVAALGAGGGEDAGLDERFAQAEERASSLASELETLRGEVARLGEQAGGEAASVDLGPVEERLAAVEAAIAGLDAGGAPEAALAAVDDAVAALREEAAAARAGQAALSARLDALEETLATLSGRLDERAEAPAAAIIIAASALKAAIDRGTPFTTELETWASLVPDAPEIAELRALAADGVPTRAQIAAESDAAANAMIAAARPVAPQDGLLDRLWASAQGLVQVRPVGMVEGDGVPEIAARLDAAVAANDYDRAIAEYETLPEAAKATGAPFMARLRARHAADRLIDRALAAALRA